MQADGTGTYVWASYFTEAGVWSAREQVSEGPTTSQPEVAMDAAGNAICVWAQMDPVRADLYARRFIAGSGWQAPQLIEHEDDGRADLPQIAMSTSGDAMVVWTYYEGGTPSVWAVAFR
jgi:hypothetical protein